MHYFDRYQGHLRALELEGELRARVEQSKLDMAAEGGTHRLQKQMDDAFKVLQDCRRTLKYTYPFAFYLERTNQAQVFEDNQAHLEQVIEVLAGLLDQEIDVDKNADWVLMDKANYCDQRRRILLQHCKEGYREHYWTGLNRC